MTGISEVELRRAYSLGPVARPCLCGGVVIADPTDPTEGMIEHQATTRHQAWRAWVEVSEDGCAAPIEGRQYE